MNNKRASDMPARELEGTGKSALPLSGRSSIEEFLHMSASVIPDRGICYVIDVRRSTTETIWASSGDCGSWFPIPAAAIDSIEAMGSAYGGDPVQTLCYVLFKDEFASLTSTFASLTRVTSGSFCVRPDPPSLPVVSLIRKDATIQHTTWTLDHISRGVCEMETGAQFILRNDGTGSLIARIKTNHTHRGVYWHQRFRVKNQPGAVLFVLPAGIGYYTGPRMDDDHGWYDWRVDFAYNQASYPYVYWLEYGEGSC